MTTNYQIDVSLKEVATGNKVFSESYELALRKEFVDNKTPKEHGFKNHVEAFLVQLKNNCKTITKQTFKKRELYVVSFGMNTGSEIN